MLMCHTQIDLEIIPGNGSVLMQKSEGLQKLFKPGEVQDFGLKIIFLKKGNTLMMFCCTYTGMKRCFIVFFKGAVCKI